MKIYRLVKNYYVDKFLKWGRKKKEKKKCQTEFCSKIIMYET